MSTPVRAVSLGVVAAAAAGLALHLYRRYRAAEAESLPTDADAQR